MDSAINTNEKTENENIGEDEPLENEENTEEANNVEDNESENDEQIINEENIDERGDKDILDDADLEDDGEVEKNTKEEELEKFEIQEKQEEKAVLKDIDEVTDNEEDLNEEHDKQEKYTEYEKQIDQIDSGLDNESLFTRGRGSILYEIGPRIRDLEDNQLGGDFVMLQEEAPLKFYKYMDEKDEEEDHEESIAEEEEITIDRTPYYEKYENLTKEITTQRIKNNILQKKMAKIFKRRKMDHVLKETDQQFDTIEKYNKKLDAYGELSNLDSSQRSTITNELENLKSEKESKHYELNKLFEDLQTQEKDTGYGLIHTKTGKPIPDKLVERLLQRQKHQMKTVGDMRLKYIQLKNMVSEKQNAISQLDKIGENLYLMDYEQLKVENRSYMDKMEEKDEELSRLRNKCQKTIQILAHMREKSAALESDIDDLADDLQNLNQNSMAVRGNLNQLKQERDYYRNMTNKLREESGLLTQSDLLRDMEVSMAELKSMTKELEFLKEEHKNKAQQIRNIRKNIEYPPESLLKKTQKDISDKATRGRHLYRGRPSLHKPTIPEDAFKHLRNFKGKARFDKQDMKNITHK